MTSRARCWFAAAIFSNSSMMCKVAVIAGLKERRDGLSVPMPGRCVCGYLPSRMRAWAMAASVMRLPESILAISVMRSSSVRRAMPVRPSRL